MLERNQQTFDDVKFLKTVTLLKKAKGIYLAGLGISSLAPQEKPFNQVDNKWYYVVCWLKMKIILLLVRVWSNQMIY